jgi:hypothetical protein
MTETKPILREFVAWLETAFGNAERGAASEFGVELPPDSLGVAEIALAVALNGDRPVLLGSSLPMRSIVAALVLRGAGIKLEQVFQGTLTDDQFERLANVLMEVKKSKLLIESSDGQPGADAGAD